MKARRAERHEEAAVDVRRVHRVGAGLVAGLAALAAVAFLLWRFWLAPPPPAPIPQTEVPPAPRLQPHPADDLAALHASQQARLHGYAWVDRRHGIARIPVRRAMALLAAGATPRPPAAASTVTKP